MARFDLESFLREFIPAVRANLTAAITAINAEKGDSLLLDIPAGGWLFGSLDDRIKNFTDFGFIFIDDTKSKVSGPSVERDYSIEVDLFISQREDGYDAEAALQKDELRVLRYWRALEQACTAAWGKVGRGYDYVEIEVLNQIDVKLNDSAYYHKLIGVSVSFSING